eukprot:644942-Rhodomonas_salina.1
MSPTAPRHCKPPRSTAIHHRTMPSRPHFASKHTTGTHPRLAVGQRQQTHATQLRSADLRHDA